MPRGRKPDGAALQAAKGNPGRRRRAPVEEKPIPVTVGAITPPKWLRKSRRAVDVWNEIAPLLAKMNILSPLDAQPLARYCRYSVEWITADEAVRKEGAFFAALDTNGSPTKKRHPAFQAWIDLEKLLREIEEAFGLRPEARFKMLRDQAAALGGNMPLFGGEGKAQRNETEPETDAIGILARLDSQRPSRPN